MYVMLDDDPPGNSKAADSALAVARERVRGLEAQVALLQEQLELVNGLKATQEQRGPGGGSGSGVADK